jgi:hypothetical protein
MLAIFAARPRLKRSASLLAARNLKIYLCRHCACCKVSRTDRAPRRSAAVSSGADWGNVRYGGGFAPKRARDAAQARASPINRCALSMSALNRASFARAFLAAAPAAQLTCVEPDERVADSCGSLARAELVSARIEATHFPMTASTSCIRVTRSSI